MEKVQVIDFDDWVPYDGFAEGSGRGEKIWLQSKEGRIGLFKFPKVDPDTKNETTEHISEHIACHIGKIIGIETAHVDIGVYHGRKGCMSYLLNQLNECIIEGALFISGKHPDYDLDKMQELNTGRYYCFDHLLEVGDTTYLVRAWIEMMLFDFLIGNSDRHQNNWAILVQFSDPNKNSLKGRFCPLYDNGSSLCCYIKEDDIDSYLGKDTNRFRALTDSKSRSMIRMDGFAKQHPTHSQVVRELMSDFPVTKAISTRVITSLRPEVIDNLMQSYVGILTDKKIDLITRYLKRKVEILEDLTNGGSE